MDYAWLYKLFASALMWCLATLRGSVDSTQTPNFVIMLMDDMGYGDLGVNGNPVRETPNLDKMAAEGMQFPNFYTASPICSPSRASVMSGRLPIRNGFYSDNKQMRNSYTPQDVMGGIPDSEVLFPEVLNEHGYTNKIIGKWHLGHRPQYLPLRHGFHEWFGAPNCHYFFDNKVMPNIPVYRNAEMAGRYYDDFHIDTEKGLSNLTQMYINEALEFIERMEKAKKPFMLYWAPDATHTPLYASSKFRGKSKRGLYGDAVMELDYGVGQILKKLEELKIAENTFTFFSSDNGAATYGHLEGGSNAPFLCGKQTTFEGGMREPGIARWPGKIKPGQISGQTGNLMDLYLTMLDLANIPRPKNVTFDGISLKEALLNGTAKDRATFFYRGETLFKVRYGPYKAHFYSWGSPEFAQKLDYHYCPGQEIKNLTQTELGDYHEQPMLFHVERDPGEKYYILSNSTEYEEAVSKIFDVVRHHKVTLKPGEPQLNWCDLAIQNWAPPGCEKVKRCLKGPRSWPYKCDWPY